MKINKQILELVKSGLKATTLSKLTESQINSLHKRLPDSKKESNEAVTKTSTTTTYDLSNTADVSAANKALGGMANIDPNQKKLVVTKEGEMVEKAESVQQQKFMGVVRAMQKGDLPKKGKAGEVAKEMNPDDVKDFASTKHKGLPKKVKKETKEEGTPVYQKTIENLMTKNFDKAVNSKLPKFTFGESELENQITKLVEKHISPKMTKSDFLKTVKNTIMESPEVLPEPVIKPSEPKIAPSPNQPSHPQDDPLRPGRRTKEKPAPQAGETETAPIIKPSEPKIAPSPNQPSHPQDDPLRPGRRTKEKPAPQAGETETAPIIKPSEPKIAPSPSQPSHPQDDPLRPGRRTKEKPAPQAEKELPTWLTWGSITNS